MKVKTFKVNYFKSLMGFNCFDLQVEFYREVSDACDFLLASYCLEAQRHCLLVSSLRLYAARSCLVLAVIEGCHVQILCWSGLVQSSCSASHHWPSALGMQPPFGRALPCPASLSLRYWRTPSSLRPALSLSASASLQCLQHISAESLVFDDR